MKDIKEYQTRNNVILDGECTCDNMNTAIVLNCMEGKWK